MSFLFRGGPQTGAGRGGGSQAKGVRIPALAEPTSDFAGLHNRTWDTILSLFTIRGFKENYGK